MRRYFLTLACVLLLTSLVSAQEKPLLPKGAIARLGTSRLHVASPILSTAFTPDKSTFVVVHEEKDEKKPNVVLFDVATGSPRKQFTIPQGHLLAMARHKPVLAMATNLGVEVWDLKAEKRLQTFIYPDEWAGTLSLAISPDGNQILASERYADPSRIIRGDVQTGKESSVLAAAGKNCSVSFSENGNKIFAITFPHRRSETETIPGKVIAWNAATGKIITKLENPYDSGAAVSPDGKSLAFGKNGKSILLVDIYTRKTRTVLNVPHSCFVVTPFLFTPNGKQLVVVSKDQSSRLWDIATDKEAHSFGSDLWPSTWPPVTTLDGELLAAQHGLNTNRALFWEVATGLPKRYPTLGHPSSVSGLAYSPDGRWLATCSANFLLIFDSKTGKELHAWIAHKSAIEQIVFSPDGKLLASASSDGTIGLWDPTTGKERKRLTAKDPIKSIAFNRDGTTLSCVCAKPKVVGSNPLIQTWDLEKGVIVRSLEAPSIQFGVLSPTAHYCVGNGRSSGTDELYAPMLWMDLQSGKRQPIAKTQSDELLRRFYEVSPWDFAFSVDSKLFATSDRYKGHSVGVSESVTRREILRFQSNPTLAHLLAISPDGRILAHGVDRKNPGGLGDGNRTLILRDISAAQNDSWDAEKFREVPLIDGHVDNITCLTFSPDSQFIATGGNDQVVYIWHVKNFLKQPKFIEEKAETVSYWPQLADADAGKAYRAIAQLERRPTEAVALLRRHLKPVAAIDETLINKYLHDLNSANFAVRQRAYTALETHGEQGLHLLQAVYKNPPSLEVKRRLEPLLDKLDNCLTDADHLRAYRCLTLLERINSADSRQLLEELSRGAPAAWLTVEAKYSLQRCVQLAAIGK